jgi:hypothetical protein
MRCDVTSPDVICSDIKATPRLQPRTSQPSRAKSAANGRNGNSRIVMCHYAGGQVTNQFSPQTIEAGTPKQLKSIGSSIVT